MKEKKVFLLIVIVLLIILFLFLKNEKNVLIFLDKEEQANVSQTVENEVEKVEITYQQHVIFEKNFLFNVKIKNFNTSNNYKVIFKVNNQNYGEKTIIKNDESISIDNLTNIVEGENSIEIQYLVNEQNIGTSSFSIFYIEPYTKQFLDEFSDVGFSTHFGYMYNRDNEKDIQLLKNMGCYNVRDDIRFNLMDKLEWVDKLYENDIKLYGILLPQPKYGLGEGNDWAVNNEEEFEEYANNMSILASKIDDKVYKYEMSNEPNWFIYTKENIKWYSKQTEKTMEIVGKSKKTDDFVIGATCANGAADKQISSIDFLTEVENNNLYKYNIGISFHSYDLKHSLDSKHQELTEQHLDFINNYGGFQHLYISEYGMDTSYDGESEDFQAKLLVRQSVYNDMYGIKNSYIYSFRDMGFDKDDPEHYYGVITYDRKPKKAYYAVKEYFENINGAEYIGNVNIADGIVAHVYNKDGKAKIVAWADKEESTIDIDFSGFTVKNICGNEIENTNGILTVSDEPVYLDNVSNKYFYVAISNTALNKYKEFEEKFATELSSIESINEKIEELKQYMSSIRNNETETQDKAIQKMSEHFALGNTILNAYNNGNLGVDYVKLSSMLDMLNDIGKSYEDLITVSATTREAYFTSTSNLIEETEGIIYNNTDLQIIYPSKILDFSKELDEKAEYINSLEEENDIKTGLIVSNSLHAYYLADWANEFAQIYVDNYVKANPVTLTYSNTDEFTNQDVTVTLNIGTDSKVTNNEGKNTYTFTQNDDFTFEYTRRGQAYTIEAKVSNIDKEPPKILGVINGKIYLNTVKPIITDKNLQTVEVLFNDEKIQYSNDMTFSNEGIYDIMATDKAGNTTKVEFYIVEDVINGYVIKDNYILNVNQKTTVDKFIDGFNITNEYDILRNGTHLTNNEIVATGDTIKLDNGESYTIVVAGDLNGDGIVANYDLSALRRYILRIRDFNELESLAADINIDGRALGVKDYTRIRIEILGKIY